MAVTATTRQARPTMLRDTATALYSNGSTGTRYRSSAAPPSRLTNNT